MILTNAELAEIERHSSWFGEVERLIASHRELFALLQEVTEIRCAEMALNARLKELIERG